MSRKHLHKVVASIIIYSLSLFSGSSYASTLMIDNFSHVQSVADQGNSPGTTSGTVIGLTGTDLVNASRTFVAGATDGSLLSRETIRSVDNLLIISNNSRSAGSASVVWDFDPIDFTGFGNAILLEVKSIDLNVNIEMLVNGVSSSGLKSFGSAGNFLINFSEFSDSSVFTRVNSFSLNFAGPSAWDGQFQLLTTIMPRPELNTSSPVPLPSALVMMGSALLGFFGVSRRKMQFAYT